MGQPSSSTQPLWDHFTPLSGQEDLPIPTSLVAVSRSRISLRCRSCKSQRVGTQSSARHHGTTSASAARGLRIHSRAPSPHSRLQSRSAYSLVPTPPQPILLRQPDGNLHRNRFSAPQVCPRIHQSAHTSLFRPAPSAVQLLPLELGSASRQSRHKVAREQAVQRHHRDRRRQSSGHQCAPVEYIPSYQFCQQAYR